MIKLPYFTYNKNTIQDEDDIKLVRTLLGLYMRFIKEHGLMSHLYQYRPGVDEDGRFYISSVNDCGRFVIKTTTKAQMGALKRLRLSQLWRFYILDHAYLLAGFNRRASFISSLKNSIKDNGYRDSEEIKRLFSKYNILNDPSIVI